MFVLVQPTELDELFCVTVFCSLVKIEKVEMNNRSGDKAINPTRRITVLQDISPHPVNVVIDQKYLIATIKKLTVADRLYVRGFAPCRKIKD